MKKITFNSAKRKGRHKTTTRSFRINVEWDEILEQEAEKQGISTSSLLNKILRKYSLYSRWNQHIDTIHLSKQMLRKILNLIQVESLAEAGSKSGSLDPINLINTIGLPNDYDSFVYLMTNIFGGPCFAMWFTCFHHKQENKDLFHLQHDLGEGWSIYLEQYILSFLKSIPNIKEVKTRSYKYAVTIEVKPPNIELG